ncbi:MAG TPA: PIG-L family deacetylase [Trebonia sp.]|jgi:LmbE family N-acetylglucosaminyl deacetylase
MTIEADARPSVARAFLPASLPSAVRVLAVTARPGQESVDLGGLLYAFRRSGASLSLLCLTRGDVGGKSSSSERLEAARPWEVQMAASILGIRQVSVGSYRDGILQHYRTSDLAGRIQEAVSEYSADLVLIIAPEVGDMGDAAVARAATAAALRAEVPVAGCTRPGVSGAWQLALGADAEIARAIQRAAAAAHATQAESLPALISRLDQLGDVETLRWLVSPARIPSQRAAVSTVQMPSEPAR